MSKLFFTVLMLLTGDYEAMMFLPIYNFTNQEFVVEIKNDKMSKSVFVNRCANFADADAMPSYSNGKLFYVGEYDYYDEYVVLELREAQTKKLIERKLASRGENNLETYSARGGATTTIAIRLSDEKKPYMELIPDGLL